MGLPRHRGSISSVALERDEHGFLVSPLVWGQAPSYFLVHLPGRWLQAYQTKAQAESGARMQTGHDLSDDDVYVAESVVDDDDALFYSKTFGYSVAVDLGPSVGLEDYPYLLVVPQHHDREGRIQADQILLSLDGKNPVGPSDLPHAKARWPSGDVFLVRRVAEDPVLYEGAPAAVVSRYVSDQLARINAHRTRLGLSPLDPIAAGWTDEDVTQEDERIARLPNLGLLP